MGYSTNTTRLSLNQHPILMNKKMYTFVLLSWVFTTAAYAQFTKFIVQLTDKNRTPYSINKPSAYLSSKAIERRTRYNIPIDITDMPITPYYIDSLRNTPGVTIHNVSKWLNQVCIAVIDSATAFAKINTFSFVKQWAPVATSAPPVGPLLLQPNNKDTGVELQNLTPLSNAPAVLSAMNQMQPQDFYDYGSNAAQIKIHEGDYLHNNGFHGEGITIAFLDGGFNNFKTNIALDSTRFNHQILGEWDFVSNEASTNEDHYHGFACLSTVATNRPGIMVGTAPKANFWLLRTEDVSSESPIEEQNWAAAAEYADSVGVDMISSSLGYSNFDNSIFDHSYPQRNGNTAISTIAADLAAKKGILVTNSAGNSGRRLDDLKYVSCPSDGDSVLCVGATDVNGVIASFSSWGPNGAGKTKPNVVSVGARVVIASYITGDPGVSNGTSFSNPNLCGLTACLWQAFPDFNNMEIIDALQRSAHKYNTPDDRFGYGIPNMRKAFELLQAQRIARLQNTLGSSFIKAYPVPANATTTILLKAPTTGKSSLRLVDVAGKTIEIKTVDMVQNNFYTISFSALSTISHGVYTVQYVDGQHDTALKIVK
jgi:serine protease AprX